MLWIMQFWVTKKLYVHGSLSGDSKKQREPVNHTLHIFFSTAPIGVSSPFDVVVVTGYIITAKWTVPQSISGLLSKYVLRAYNLDYFDIPPVQAEYGDKIFAGKSFLFMFSHVLRLN